jgi:2-(1,2-epoxy-1,2-dihydrophenyl)acetyl-CoA isomerase
VTGLAAKPLLVQSDAGVAWITLDRPDSLNSMSIELMDSLVVALEQLAADPSVRCVGLRGSGRAFCAGGDIADIARRREEASNAPSLGALLDAQYRTMLRHVHAARLLHEMPKPTVAAVHGHAVGGGLALALACDFRVVTETAKLRVGFAARSLSGDFGISYLLVHTVGSAKARELMLLDPLVSGAEAERIGLATRVCPDDALEATAAELVHQLASGPTIALGRMKDNLLAAERLGFEQVLQVESMNARISANTSDAKEAGLAFAERRAAMFTGS